MALSLFNVFHGILFTLAAELINNGLETFDMLLDYLHNVIF